MQCSFKDRTEPLPWPSFKHHESECNAKLLGCEVKSQRPMALPRRRSLQFCEDPKSVMKTPTWPYYGVTGNYRPGRPEAPFEVVDAA